MGSDRRTGSTDARVFILVYRRQGGRKEGVTLEYLVAFAYSSAYLLLQACFDDIERVVDAGSDSAADTAQKHVLPRRQLVPAEVRGQPRLEHLVAGEVHGLAKQNKTSTISKAREKWEEGFVDGEACNGSVMHLRVPEASS